MPIFERFCARFFENYFFWRKKDRRGGHFGRFSTLQNSSKEPTRCAIFGKRSSHTACSGRGFCLVSFLNSIRWHVWSGPMKRSSGMPLCPFFSNLHAIQPWRRACSLQVLSRLSSSWRIVVKFNPAAIRFVLRAGLVHYVAIVKMFTNCARHDIASLSLSLLVVLARAAIFVCNELPHAFWIALRAVFAINHERRACVVYVFHIVLAACALSARVPCAGVCWSRRLAPSFCLCHISKCFAHLKFLRGLKSKKSQVLKICRLLHQRQKSLSYSDGVRSFLKSRNACAKGVIPNSFKTRARCKSCSFVELKPIKR